MLAECKQGEFFCGGEVESSVGVQGAGAGAGVDEQRLWVRWWERVWMWE